MSKSGVKNRTKDFVAFEYIGFYQNYYTLLESF